MQRTRRPILFAIVGILIWGIAGYLVYDYKRPHAIAAGQKKYTYQISQSATSTPHYTQNEFYGSAGSPGAGNTAYIASLTDYLNARFNYTFTGSSETDLKYSYKAEAVVRSQFSGKDSTDKASNVWSKRYTLLEPVTGNERTKELSLSRNVEIPFADYAAEITKFNSTYNIPLSSEVVVTYEITVSGNADGVPFKNTQISTVVAPLDQRIYKIAVKFNKTDSKDIVSKRTARLQTIIDTYELPAAGVLALIGLCLSAYGFRRQIIKSAYERELARIYRYNEGIIVKARRPVSLKHLTIVDLDSFDDLLSIAEETGMPIVANELLDTVTRSTRFIITSGDTAYVFTLGGTTPKEDWEDDDDDDPSKPPEFKQQGRKSQVESKPAPKGTTKINVSG